MARWLSYVVEAVVDDTCSGMCDGEPSAGPRRPVVEREKQTSCKARQRRHGGFMGGMTLTICRHRATAGVGISQLVEDDGSGGAGKH